MEYFFIFFGGSLDNSKYIFSEILRIVLLRLITFTVGKTLL